ncbi:hypothetical protein F4808DRAFT_417566 [Astrocystis sublimbata]|nr:hypothetical protein F4808DRAFT_417566 [Astrocystis sublimbata]
MADNSSTASWGRASSAQLARRSQGPDALLNPNVSGSYLTPPGAQSYPSLRPAPSRFSLNEQFSTTRRDYDFGAFDDASSIWERGTIRSSHHFDDFDTPGGVPNTNGEGLADLDSPDALPPLGESDVYDVLCVSRYSSAESIRRAYFRLFALLDPHQQPQELRQVAEEYLRVIQAAFEMLLDPSRRAKYDLESYEYDVAIGDASDDQETHDQAVQRMRHLAITEKGPSTWDLGARFDAQRMIQPAQHEQSDSRLGGVGLEPIDFEMNHATSFDMTELDWRINRIVHRLQQYFTTSRSLMVKGPVKHPIARRTDGTTMTLRGSVYTILRDQVPVSFPSYRRLLGFPYAANRNNFISLRNAVIQPLMAVNLRHVIPYENDYSMTGARHILPLENSPNREDTVVEIETTVIPHPATALRISKPMVLPLDNTMTFISMETEQSLLRSRPPRLATTLERPTLDGRLLLHLDSGYSTGFSGIFQGRGILGGLLNGSPYTLPPRAEIAFKTGGTFESQRALITSRSESQNQGIGALDCALDSDEKRAWTLTASAEPLFYSVSAKYARDISLSPPRLRYLGNRFLETLLQKRKLSSPKAASTTTRRFRMEAEIGAMSPFSTGYLAFRCLKRVGRLSKLGFEMGLSMYSLHLSVYWSRLGQRISVPFYLCSRSSTNLKTFLLTTILPFTGFALWEIWDQHRRRKRAQQRLETLQEHEYTQKRRNEADTLTSLMSPAVQSRQRVEGMEHGLVILSAKYGVKDRDASDAAAWGAAEVADVTVPVAALVDRGELHIPARVRKNHILGFWDPEPEDEKVLHIRYSFGGRVDTIEVRGDEHDLVLPPMKI